MTAECKTESRLEKILRSGKFAVTGECGPPRGADPEVIRKKCGLLKNNADAFNITDNQTSVVRMSSTLFYCHDAGRSGASHADGLP
jgi:methylenetetrahydrofolate reductase (NADPH)